MLICRLFYFRYLLDTESYLDETRVGIWGWGFGGYVTAMVLSTQQDIFKCGISVSPISDWLYYSKYEIKTKKNCFFFCPSKSR